MIQIKYSKYKDTRNHRGPACTFLITFSNQRFRKELIFLREDMMKKVRFQSFQKYIFEKDFKRKVIIKIDKDNKEIFERPFSEIEGKWEAGGINTPIEFEYSTKQLSEKKYNFPTILALEKPLLKSLDIVIKYELISINQIRDWYTQKEILMCGELIFRKGHKISPSFSEYNIICSQIDENLEHNLEYLRMQIDSIEIID